jgi:hypothetical protein
VELPGRREAPLARVGAPELRVRGALEAPLVRPAVPLELRAAPRASRTPGFPTPERMVAACR